jgi:hypothetical protein
MGVEVSMPLMHQLMDSFSKEFSGLLQEPLHHCGRDVFI